MFHLYTNFCQHTTLEDAVYKSVFLQLQDVISKAIQLRWKSFKFFYKGEEDISEYNLDDTTIPFFVIDSIRNMLHQFYNYPNSAVCELAIEYKNIPYLITLENNILSIPEDVSFIKTHNLFDLFITNKPCMNVFEAFDDIFSFMNIYKRQVISIFPYLEARFERTYKAEEYKNETARSLSEVSLELEDARDKREDLVKNLEQIQKDRAIVEEQYKNLLESAKSFTLIESEKTSLEEELEQSNTNIINLKEQQSKIRDILDHISRWLEFYATKQTLTDDEVDARQQYLEKKQLYINQLKEQLSILSEAETYHDSLVNRYKEIRTKYISLSESNDLDADTLLDKLSNLKHLEDEVYIDLHTLEAKIEQLKEKEEDIVVKDDKNDFNVGSTTIIDHLKTPNYPQPLTTVLNYLKYYFVYTVKKIYEKIAQDDKYQGFSEAMLNSIAIRIALHNQFQISLPQLFSVIPIPEINTTTSIISTGY